MKLEEKLVQLRKEKGISQLQVAEELDVSRQAISRWEVGAALPSTDNLRRLAELYGVSIDVLLNEGIELHTEQKRPTVVLAEQPETVPVQQIPSKSKCNKRIIQLLAVAILLLSAAVLGYSIGYDRGMVDAKEIIPIPMSELDKEYWDLEEVPKFTFGWPDLVE